MSEEGNAGGEAVVDTPDTSVAENPEVGKLIAESKKYRTRAQEVEKELVALKDNAKKAEEAELAEKEEFKTLYETQKAELESSKGFKEKYNSLVQTQKDKLLEQLPEEDREKFANKDLETIEFVVGQIKQSPSDEEHRGGIRKKTEINKSDIQFSDRDSSRKNWKDILNSYKE